ncbi:MAG: sigma-70 family RNA polymerase sigma factor [Faecousia sp.]
MMELEYSFEQTPWEAYLSTLQAGDTVYAGKMLALLEGESADALEDAFRSLEEGCMNLSVEDLPRSAIAGESGLRLRREAELVKTGLSSGKLEERDPLRLYLEEVAGLPVCGDEHLLAERCAAGDDSAREPLTNLGLARVIQLAGTYTGFGVLLMDLIQEGSIGLWEAVQCYSGGDYEALRDRLIRFYLAKAVTLSARDAGVGQKIRQAMEDYRAVDQRLLGELGRNPTLEEIAEQLHMSPETTRTVKKMLSDANAMERAARAAQPEETREEADQPVENTALFQMRQRIQELLSVLGEEDGKLLTLRFGLEGGLPLSPEETGKRLGLTPEEVLAREAAALASLRNS